MALREAVLAALSYADHSAYGLTKQFDASVANFWSASAQQVYAELPKLEAAGLVAGREVRDTGRRTKRVYTLTDLGHQALRDFVMAADATRSVFRDDLTVKSFAAGAGGEDEEEALALAAQLDARAAASRAKADLFGELCAVMTAGRTEEEFLATEGRIGPYLTCLRGLDFELGNAAFAAWGAQVIRARINGEPLPPRPGS